MKHELFISYSRVDSAFVLRLVGDLRQRGVEAWLDQLDIPPGANWDDEIEKALDHARTVVVVLSSVSAKSENLKNEIGAALERDKLVVPIVLAKGAVPLMINRLQREDFTGEYGAALDKLLHRLAGGSRTGSLRALSSEDIQRAASQAAARLGLSDGPDSVVLETSLKPGLKTLLSEQFERLDKNGDGILTQDELLGLEMESVPDSLAPRTRSAARSAQATSSRRGMLAGAAGALLVAGGLALAFVWQGRHEPSAPPPVQVGPSAPVEKIEPIAPIEPIKPVEPIKPAEKIEPVEPIKPVEPVEPVEPIAPLEPIEHEGRRGAAVVCGRPNFRGACHKIPRQPDMHKTLLGNDVASSVRLGTCRSVRICSETQFSGQCEVLSADQPDLANTSVGAKNLSSVECIGWVDR